MRRQRRGTEGSVWKGPRCHQPLGAACWVGGAAVLQAQARGRGGELAPPLHRGQGSS